MDHFVGNGGENVLLGPVPEVRRIKGDLIGKRAVGTSETIAAKIPVALLVALKRDETIRKRGLEERAIQSLVSLLQWIVSFTGRFDGLDVCVGHRWSPFQRPPLGCALQGARRSGSRHERMISEADSAFPRTILAIKILQCTSQIDRKSVV